MIVNVTQILLGNAGVTALVGSRVFYAEAPTGAAMPYVLVQQITGVPENYLAEAPSVDAVRVQVKPVASTVAGLSSLADAIDAAIRELAHCVFAGEVGFNSTTKAYWMPMDYRFWQSR